MTGGGECTEWFRERYQQNCIDEAPLHGGSIMVCVWGGGGGGIKITAMSQLVRMQGNMTAQRYVQDIVLPHVLPLMVTPRAVFQQDNARPHTARLTIAFLTANNINTLALSFPRFERC
jgi:hypothetical protein